MSTPPVNKPKNGKTPLRVKCSQDCEVAQTAADALSIIDSRLKELSGSLSRVHDEALDFRRAVLESHDKVLDALKRVEERMVGKVEESNA